MMKQYREARESLEEDTLLLFRLGDFYEMFERDAERGAALLGITLTKRHDMPMAGIPSHAAEGYLTKLLKLGNKVALCDQLEPPTPGKLVKRGITRILTPGTVLEDGQLDGCSNHFLLSFELDGKGVRAAWLDLSTGKFVLGGWENPHDFLSLLNSLSPKEILVPEGFENQLQSVELPVSFKDELERVLGEVTRTERPGFDFDRRSGAREVMESLGVMNLEGSALTRSIPRSVLPGPSLFMLKTSCGESRGTSGESRSTVTERLFFLTLRPRETSKFFVPRRKPEKGLFSMPWIKR